MPTGQLVGNEATGSGEAAVNFSQLVPDSYRVTTTSENLFGSADAPQKDPSGTKTQS